MHPRIRWFSALVGTCSIAFAGQLEAQSALVLRAHGAYVAPMTNLSDTGEDFASAFGVGGSVGLQLGGRVAVRADVTSVGSRFRSASAPLSPDGVRRLFAFGDLQIGWPGTSNLIPYVLLGGGAIRTAPQAGTTATWAPGGRLGAGLNYLSGLGVFFVEGVTTGTKFSGLGFSRFQLDFAIHSGFAVAIPF